MKLAKRSGWLPAMAVAALMSGYTPAYAQDAGQAGQQQQAVRQSAGQQGQSQQGQSQQQDQAQQDQAQQAGGRGASAQQGQQGQRGAGQQGQQGGQRTETQISQEAQAVLDKMREAYRDLKSLKLEGAIEVSMDAAGQQQKQEQRFVAGFQAPNKFRHELGDQLIVGSSAKGLFAYNARSNSFLVADAPDPQAPLKDIPSPVPSILMQQNPSLFMAIEKNPLSGWTDGISRVEKAPDVQIDGQSYTALKVQGEGGATYTMAVDPKTHLVRRITADLSGALKQQGAPDVKQAQFVIDYTKVEPGADFPQDHFAWIPPQGAQDVGKERQAAMRQQENRASQGGQSAPDFTLPSLSGKEVKLSDLKGQVVVLDFWATWCPPCRESLPHLGRLYGENEDGVKVLAVNMGEEAEAAKAFVASQNLNNLTVLLDKDNSVAQKYGISSIPTTVIIGPDGKVQRTFVGLGPDTFEEIKQTVSRLKTGGEAVTAGAREQGGQGQQGSQAQQGSQGQQPGGQQQDQQQQNRQPSQQQQNQQQ